MPNRILKESIVTSDTIDALSAEAERCFYRLLVICDDYGRFDGRPAVIKGRAFPLKDELPTAAVADWLDQLASAGLIHFYEAGGRRYLQVCKWDEHQNIRAKKSKYPDPEHLIASASKCDQVADVRDPSASICNQVNADAPVTRISDLGSRISDLEDEVQRVASASAPPPDDGRAPHIPDTASRTAVAAVPSEATPAAPCRPVGPVPVEPVRPRGDASDPVPGSEPGPAPNARRDASAAVLTLEPERPAGRKRPPKQRPLPDPVAVAEREAERADGERWRERAEDALGYPRDEPWGRAWHRFRAARREHGIDTLLRSLDGLEGDAFARTCGLAALLSGALVSKGLARARDAPRGVNAALEGYVDDGPNTLRITDADRAWDGRL